MPEQTGANTPVLEKAEPVRATPPPEPPKKQKKKKKMPRAVKVVLAIVILAVVVAIVGAVLYFMVFKQEDTKGAAMTQPVMRSSIQSMVEGSGTTRARDSATITPNTGGTILELYVQEGDQVTEGQPLYTMDDSAAVQAVNEAQEAVNEAQKTVENCRKELQAIYDQIAELVIRAPHAGNLRNVGEFKIGDTVSEGATIATLVNDTKLRLSLYYSYAFEDDIAVGQTAKISIPATMTELTGTVEAVNKVRFVTPEGSVHFEVVFVLDNPGALTAGMDASASLTSAAGEPIFPYESGKLKYYETTEIKAKATGPVEEIDLLNYADVKEGAVLVRLGEKDTDTEIAAKENALKDAQDRVDEAAKKLEDAREELNKYNAVAPISGTVLSCNLTAGEEVASGQAITIADTSVMTIEIQVDERNVRYVKPGMIVDIDQYGTYYMGIVESVSQTANSENGMAVFPAVVKVDNPEGLLMSNMYVSYSFVASESSDCLVVPIQAVKYVTLPGAEGGMSGDPGIMDPGMMDPGMADPDMMDPGMMDGGGLDGADAPAGDTGDTGEPEADPDAGIATDDVAFSVEPQSYTGGAQAKPLAVAISGSGVWVEDVMPSGGGPRGGPSTNAGSEVTVCFLKTDTPPENAVEADPAWECPEGFVPVLVELGLADNMNVEIKSGLNEGDEVFIGYETLSADSWG